MAYSYDQRTSSTGPPQRLRADARRNYDALLVTATKVFAEKGLDAPLDDIARLAGVGNATLYRHFPTRRDLIVAVYADEMTALGAFGEVLLDEDAPAEALFSWLRAFVAHVATKRDLAFALDGDPWYAAMYETASRLLTAAQRAGIMHADLKAADLLTLATGIALSAADADQAERLLSLVRHGATAMPP